MGSNRTVSAQTMTALHYSYGLLPCCITGLSVHALQHDPHMAEVLVCCLCAGSVVLRMI